ncbi:MAG: hypothetical protein A07HR60_01443 [uncultured archaeon A07HR60]|nr:MAG: hypothetical protein A07HR60_01443 [uncultured archaeon A07HR60]
MSRPSTTTVVPVKRELTGDIYTLEVMGDDPMAVAADVVAKECHGEITVMAPSRFDDLSEYPSIGKSAGGNIDGPDSGGNSGETTTAEPASEPDHSDSNPAALLEQNAQTFREKNADYGGSWRLASETMSMWARELDIEEFDLQDDDQAVAYGLFWERLIKLIRAFNVELGDHDPHNEDVQESHLDESTYAAMHATVFEADESDE